MASHHMIGDEHGKYRIASPKAHNHSPGTPNRSDPGTKSTAAGTEQGTIEDAGIGAGEITGYRCWRYIDKGPARGMLMSMVVPFIWNTNSKYYKAGLIDPLCREYITDSACYVSAIDDEGFFAFKDEDRVKAEYPATPFLTYNYETPPVHIYGSIWMWGEITEHEFGYRAQYVAIRSIDNIGKHSRQWSDPITWIPIAQQNALRQRYSL